MAIIFCISNKLLSHEKTSGLIPVNLIGYMIAMRYGDKQHFWTDPFRSAGMLSESLPIR